MLVLCRKLLYRHNIRFLPFLITSALYEVIFKLVPFHTLSEQLVQDASSNRHLRRLTTTSRTAKVLKTLYLSEKFKYF